MDRRREILQHQQQRFHRHASDCDAYAFFGNVKGTDSFSNCDIGTLLKNFDDWEKLQ